MLYIDMKQIENSLAEIPGIPSPIDRYEKIQSEIGKLSNFLTVF